jgi:RNA recognition motif-containing protein
VLIDRVTNKCRGFGFVTFTSLETLDTVINNKDCLEVNGKWVDVKRAIPVIHEVLTKVKGHSN